jgi:hypothetical protein
MPWKIPCVEKHLVFSTILGSLKDRHIENGSVLETK